MIEGMQEFNKPRWFPFRNDSGEEIPAGGIIKITGTVKRARDNYLLANKPDEYGSQYTHFVNGPVRVGTDDAVKYGMCQHPDGAYALYDTTDGTPAFGEIWGPVDDEWKLRKDSGGFMILGDANEDAGLVRVVQCPLLMVLGKTDASHAKDASGTVSVYKGSTQGSESDTTYNVTAYNRYGNLDGSKWVELKWTPAGLEIIQGEC